jgi:hypothetical protein
MTETEAVILRVRKLADRSVERVVEFDPETGERYLVNPVTGDREGYPLIGVQIVNEGGAPAKTAVSQAWLLNAEAEGWAELVDKDTVLRTAGPRELPVSPEKPPHVFVQASEVVFHTVDGDFRYTVTRSPDKWPEDKDEEHPLEAGFGGEVLWTFDLELVEA